jgi:hypothetical protein
MNHKKDGIGQELATAMAGRMAVLLALTNNQGTAKAVG